MSKSGDRCCNEETAYQSQAGEMSLSTHCHKSLVSTRGDQCSLVYPDME
jgi:hypothetical protein